MIKDTITYKNKRILTIYHKGFPEDELACVRSRKEHIGRNLICFSEESVPEEEWEQMDGYRWEEHALLTPKVSYTPYHDHSCADMVHRIYPEKPQVIWKKNGQLPDEETMVQILSFIRKYTGMDLSKHPVFLGDAFLFSPRELRYHSNRSNHLVVYELKAGMKLIVRFKKGPEILQSSVIDIEKDTDVLEVSAECDWESHDIELYENRQLVYMETNVSYMKRLHLKVSMAGRTKKIPLTTLRDAYEMEVCGGVHESSAGTPPEPVREALAELNGDMVRRLQNYQASTKFLFIRPGELDNAMKQITDMMFRPAEESWIIDSYFTDQNKGLQQMTDWLRIFSHTGASDKYVVFYCKRDNAENEHAPLTAVQLKEHMRRDHVISEGLLANPGSKLQLIQTTAPIHDRFFIMRNKDTYSGLSIGTSFNSLNSNHYCIHTLAHKEAKEVLDVLVTWLNTNVAAQEVFTYDH